MFFPEAPVQDGEREPDRRCGKKYEGGIVDGKELPDVNAKPARPTLPKAAPAASKGASDFKGRRG